MGNLVQVDGLRQAAFERLEARTPGQEAALCKTKLSESLVGNVP
ncbi:hypothetical protein ACQKP5_18660 [Pseudomonas vancouverensis]